MFSRGCGCVEYRGLAYYLGLKVLETVTFSTTRFYNSADEQWAKICTSYKALMECFTKYREDKGDDDDEGTKYHVRIFYSPHFSPR